MLGGKPIGIGILSLLLVGFGFVGHRALTGVPHVPDSPVHIRELANQRAIQQLVAAVPGLRSAVDQFELLLRAKQPNAQSNSAGIESLPPAKATVEQAPAESADATVEPPALADSVDAPEDPPAPAKAPEGPPAPAESVGQLPPCSIVHQAVKPHTAYAVGSWQYTGSAQQPKCDPVDDDVPETAIFNYEKTVLLPDGTEQNQTVRYRPPVRTGPHTACRFDSEQAVQQSAREMVGYRAECDPERECSRANQSEAIRIAESLKWEWKPEQCSLHRCLSLLPLLSPFLWSPVLLGAHHSTYSASVTTLPTLQSYDTLLLSQIQQAADECVALAVPPSVNPR